ncbi:hypothetical protein BU17DRAFT_90081 [Hysterangium stoloniferum]|nr:hypothetical protein BU17DRAFT_90081 [Hysterangium stoloniferum]
MILPNELIEQIIYFLDGDIQTLSVCAVVCHVFNQISTPLLYKRIHVSPPNIEVAWQDTLGRKPFATSRLPSHAGYIEEFTLDGDLTKIRPFRQMSISIIDKIPGALQAWRNLRKVTLKPHQASGTALQNIIKALRTCPSLKSITVNDLVMGEDIVPDLVELCDLEEITLLNPTRDILMALIDWIGRMRSTITALHLLNNCGSLTPGILRKLTPHLCILESLSIGISYSLTDADIFSCLSELPKLKSLQLQYYYQQGSLPPGPTLLSLQSLTVCYDLLIGKYEAVALSTWIRRISSSSPLEHLIVRCYDSRGRTLSFDGLLLHVAHRHRQSLCSIQMPKAHVRTRTLHTLLQICGGLTDLSLNVAFSALKSFPTMATECHNLRTVSFDVCDYQGLTIDKANVQKVLQLVPSLRSFSVNNVQWKREWVPLQTKDGTIVPNFAVTLVRHKE